MLLHAGNVSCPVGKASKVRGKGGDIFGLKGDPLLGWWDASRRRWVSRGGLAESWEVGVEAWMTCCCLAVGVSVEEASVGRSLDEFLIPLR